MKRIFLPQAAARPPRLILPRPSLGDEVYELLLSEIISLRLPPCERLSVDGLSRRFGVSQTPVRAALIRLESEGLVTRKHNTGYKVAPQLSGGRFRDVFEFRLLVEPAAAALAAERAGKASIREMTKRADEMARLADENTETGYSRFALLDSAFHASIASACANTVIEESLERLYAQMHLFRLAFHAAVARETIEEHRDIVEAIRAGKPRAAEAAMRKHVLASRARMEPFYNAK